jgi:rRNA maturation RNase YbeY
MMAERDPLDLTLALVEDVPSPSDLDEEQLASLAAFVLTAEEAGGPWDLTVALVDDARLQALHRDFMGIDEPTDIMTFPADEADPAVGGGGGLAISVDHARTQAAAWGLTPAAEIRYLVVHGLLHLLGWRDEDETSRQLMLARQDELITGWQAGVS